MLFLTSSCHSFSITAAGHCSRSGARRRGCAASTHSVLTAAGPTVLPLPRPSCLAAGAPEVTSSPRLLCPARDGNHTRGESLSSPSLATVVVAVASVEPTCPAQPHAAGGSRVADIGRSVVPGLAERPCDSSARFGPASLYPGRTGPRR